MTPESFNPNGVGLQNGNFIGLPFTPETASLVLLPVPWDVTVSYRDGTCTGPENIRKASPQLDLYLEDFPEAWEKGIALLHSDPDILNKSRHNRELASWYIGRLEDGEAQESTGLAKIRHQVNEACLELQNWVEASASRWLDSGKWLGLVGGDHSTPLGFLRALAKREGAFGILHFDAHADLREAYEGFTYSHASIFHNVLQIREVNKLVQVGIRDLCHEEARRIAGDPERIVCFSDQQIRDDLFRGGSFHEIATRIIGNLPDKVYISFDIDSLMPYLCPNTGTPVPGGLEFAEAVYLIRLLSQSGRKIIGFDLCETAPLGNDWDGNVASRILYFLCAALISTRS